MFRRQPFSMPLPPTNNFLLIKKSNTTRCLARFLRQQCCIFAGEKKEESYGKTTVNYYLSR